MRIRRRTRSKKLQHTADNIDNDDNVTVFRIE